MILKFANDSFLWWALTYIIYYREIINRQMFIFYKFLRNV